MSAELAFAFGGAAPDDAAAIEQQDFVGEALDVHEHVGADDQAGAALLEGVEQGEDGFAGGGVEALEWLVEDEEFGGVEQGQGEGGFLAHAVGAGGGEAGTALGEAERDEELFDAVAGLFFVEMVDGGAELEVFFDAEGVEQAEVFGHDAEGGAPGTGGGFRPMAEDADGAGGLRFEAGKDFEAGGLSGAVRSYEYRGARGREL